jgi:hypothetical protein
VSADADRVRARALAGRLARLEEGALRTRAAARALSRAPPVDAACLLAEALALAAEGEALLATAFAEALLSPALIRYERLAALYAAAVEAGLEDVRRLLVSPPPRRAWEPRREPSDPRLAHLTLGHKKALARADRNPDLLARLAAEGEPAVVRELLRNPRLTEAEVVRIAARRPCRPETLRCVHDDRRWRTRPAVARAIAMNPFAEPALASKLLARLAERDLAAIASDATLHPLVRGLAASLGRGRAGGAPGAGEDR